jgi:hypothetical protein
MKIKTILFFIVVMIVLFVIICRYCNNTIESIQYGIPRLPSPLTIYRNQIEQDQREEHFSQTMQDELSTIGTYTSSPPLPDKFDQCVSVCDDKMNRCIATGNPTSCEYNYRICRQDCGWTTRQLK